MLKKMLEDSHNMYFKNWAKARNYEIIDCSSPNTEYKQHYAKEMQALVVDCPTGKSGYVLVVKILQSLS